MKIISNIKKYRKSIGFSLIIVGVAGSALGISLFFGGGLHGVGIPDKEKDNTKVVNWTRVSMGLINFNGTGELLNWLKSINLINADDTSISFRNFKHITTNKLIRANVKAGINTSKAELQAIQDKGIIGVAKQLQIRTNIDLMENLLLVNSMYELCIAGTIVMPLGVIIFLSGLYLWYSGIRKDKKEKKMFLDNLEKLNKEGKK